MKEKGIPSSRLTGGDDLIESSIVNEPEVLYVVDQVRDGLPFSAFEVLRKKLGVTEDRLGELLGISRATLHRRKKAAHLERAESDRLARYERLFAHAAATFGGAAEAREWLGTPALDFHWETPLDYADTEIGAQAVDRLLGRIEHGVFS
ncbi:MAG: DUF2384 domain-containing protein [Luteolibacter sp.]